MTPYKRSSGPTATLLAHPQALRALVRHKVVPFLRALRKDPHGFTKKHAPEWVHVACINVCRLVQLRPLLRTPKKLLPRRRRLSMGLTSKSDQKAYERQSRSVFFAEFPLEIRQQIYGYVLADHDVFLTAEKHIVRAGRYEDIVEDRTRLRGAVHESRVEDVLCTDRYTPLVRSFTKNNTKEYMALLLTCRAIYTEAMDTMYSSNRFFVRYIPTMLRLPSLLLPHRFHSIRTLRLWISFDHTDGSNPDHRNGAPVRSIARRRDWATVWMHIRSMENLRDLRVWIPPCGMCSSYSDELEPSAALLDPIFFPRPLDRFDLYLGCAHESTVDLEIEGCTIKGVNDRGLWEY